MDELLNTGFAWNSGKATGTFDVHFFEWEVVGLPVTADQIDDNVRVANSLANGLLVLEMVRLEENLSQVTDELQTKCFVVVGPVRDDNLKVDSVLVLFLIADLAKAYLASTFA